jgi:hypothetical protein
MTELISTPVAPAGERQFSRLTQVTVASDDQISTVNQLLTEGWRLLSIGYRADATIYVLGWHEDKPRPRTGFLS